MSSVVIYEHANYKGASKELDAGNYDICQMGIPNDTLSSLRVPSGMKATLYEHAHFAGRTKTFTSDTDWVGNDFNDITSAIKVEALEVASNTQTNVFEDAFIRIEHTYVGTTPLKEGFLSGTVKVTNIGKINVLNLSLQFLIDDTGIFWDANYLTGDSLTESFTMELGILHPNDSVFKKYAWDLKNRVPDLSQPPFKVNLVIVPRYHVEYSQVTGVVSSCQVG